MNWNEAAVVMDTSENFNLACDGGQFFAQASLNGYGICGSDLVLYV